MRPDDFLFSSAVVIIRLTAERINAQGGFGMKKISLLLAFTVTVISWLMLLPGFAFLSIPTVRVMVPVYTDIKSTLDCDGTVTALNKQIVSFGYPIQAKKLYVRIGDSVQAGQKLMDIDRQSTEEAMRSITAAAIGSSGGSSAKDSGNNSANTSGNPSGTSDAASSALSDQAAVEGNGSALDRILNQYYSGNNSAKSLSDEASGALSQADQSSDNETGASDQNMADIPDAVYATVSGTVTQLNASEGSFTQATLPLVVVSDPNSIKVKAQVPDSLVRTIKTGQSALIDSDAVSAFLSGKVTQIYPTARTVVSSSGTQTVVDVILDITRNDSVGQLIEGSSVTASITTAENAKAVSIPYEYIQEDNAGKEYVVKVQKGRIFQQYIKTGIESSSSVEVTEGIKAGDMLVYSPDGSVKNGQIVKTKRLQGGSHD